MKKKQTTKKKNIKKTNTQKHQKSKKTTNEHNNIKKLNRKTTVLLILFLGVLLIFSTYAWFSTNLNVKIKTFKMAVEKNGDLTISFDGITYDYSLEISKSAIYDDLSETYPTHLSQWVGNGFIPVSSSGIANSNTQLFDMFETSGVLYARRDRERKNGFLNTEKSDESKPREYNSYLAFELFVKNETGSPKSDNLYLEPSTIINAVDENVSEEIIGLVNSFRIGIVKIGSVGLKATPTEIQNISCNNNCEYIIYEPNSKNHTDLSIERAEKFNIELVDGIKFPTYAYKKAGGPIYVANSISGSPNLDPEYFEYQETLDENMLDDPICEIPNGITKLRIYVWIEGQDIDSLETNSQGAEVEIGIDFVKDTEGYTSFDE